MKKAQHRLKKAVQAAVEPTAGLLSLPIAPPKRGRGRPKKQQMAEFDMEKISPASSSFESAKKMSKDLDSKALVVFRRAIADAEKAMMTPEVYDGGGTSEEAHSVTKESLQRRVSRRLNVLDRYLTDDKLIELLAFSSLKEIGIYEAILLDKSLVLQGQPNVIIGNDERASMASILPRLMQELHRRKLIASTSQAVASA